jgi:tRNA(Ile)-lysidine synthase
MSLRHVESICDIVDAERPNSRLTLPHLVSVVRAYDKLSFIQADNAARDADFELLITGPGRYQLPDGATVTVGLPTTEIVHTTPDSAFFDLARTPFPWLIRMFRPGDRIVPFGMHGRKKVKDIFIDKKIPLSERTRIPLLVCGDDLLWIMGITSSELCRINQPGPTVIQATRQV